MEAVLLYLQTITETITVTHFEENKKTVEEKDRRIDELLNVNRTSYFVYFPPLFSDFESFFFGHVLLT